MTMLVKAIKPLWLNAFLRKLSFERFAEQVKNTSGS